MGHILEASCGYRKPFRVPRSGSRSLQIGPESVRPSGHPYEFFFRADSGATKWNCSRRNVKKDVQKSDIALVEWSRFNECISGTGRVHIRYTLGTYQVHVRYISGTFRVHIRYIGWLAGRICLRRRRNLPRGFILVLGSIINNDNNCRTSVLVRRIRELDYWFNPLARSAIALWRAAQ